MESCSSNAGSGRTSLQLADQGLWVVEAATVSLLVDLDQHELTLACAMSTRHGWMTLVERQRLLAMDGCAVGRTPTWALSSDIEPFTLHQRTTPPITSIRPHAGRPGARGVVDAESVSQFARRLDDNAAVQLVADELGLDRKEALEVGGHTALWDLLVREASAVSFARTLHRSSTVVGT